MTLKKITPKLQFSFENQDDLDNFDIILHPMPIKKDIKKTIKIVKISRIKKDASSNNLF